MPDISNLATGPQINLRRLDISDLEPFQAYRTDPEVGTYQSWAVDNDSKAQRFLATMSTAQLLQPGEWCQIAIALAETNQLIGDIGICVDADEAGAEIGITLSPGHQHGGRATEAIELTFGWIFDSCPATRIYGIADKRNTASIKLMDRLGMAFEDEYETEFEGEPCIEIRHAMTNERFAAMHEKR